MKNLWIFCGRVVFWLSWPALKIRLLLTKRARAVIIYKDEVLVVRSWLGNSKWTLPGGGLEVGEEALQALIREVKEEVGIGLKPKDCKNLGDFAYNSTGLRYAYTLYAVKLKDKPMLTPSKTEIVAFEWIKLNNLSTVNANSDILTAIHHLNS